MVLKKVLLSVAVCALVMALPDKADAQTRVRYRADFIIGARGNSNYDERNGVPRKIEFQVQNVPPLIDSVDAWVLSLQTGEFTYVATFPVAGVGRIEHEIERGEFVPRVQEIDLAFLFDTDTYELVSAGVYLIDD